MNLRIKFFENNIKWYMSCGKSKAEIPLNRSLFEFSLNGVLLPLWKEYVLLLSLAFLIKIWAIEKKTIQKICDKKSDTVTNFLINIVQDFFLHPSHSTITYSIQAHICKHWHMVSYIWQSSSYSAAYQPSRCISFLNDKV